jgi:tight adherence protein B
MTAVLVGVLLVLGLLLILDVLTRPAGSDAEPKPSLVTRTGRGLTVRTHEQLARAGIEGVSPVRLWVASAVIGAIVGLLMLGTSGTLTIAVAFGAIAAALPRTLVARRARQRHDHVRQLWPDVVDNLASSVRAGLALPEALAQLAERGPEPLRPAFARFAADYRASGRFDESLGALKQRLADPVGDRIVEALRVARDVGGHDLGRLLRTLSAFLRDDLRTRGELESRQSWTVNGARLAVAAPWVLLAMLSLRPEAVAAYDSGTGAVVLAIGAAVCVVAYRVMIRVGRLPDEPRVLR